MKKYIISSAICLSIFIFTIFIYYNESQKLTNREYIELTNNYIIEASSNMNHKGGNQWKALLGDIDNGYLKPELDRLNLLNTGTESLKTKLTTLNIKDKYTQEFNQIIISKYDDILSLINNDIAAKENILNADLEATDKYKLLKEIDYSVKNKIDNNFYEINTMLKQLQLENL